MEPCKILTSVRVTIGTPLQHAAKRIMPLIDVPKNLNATERLRSIRDPDLGITYKRNTNFARTVGVEENISTATRPVSILLS